MALSYQLKGQVRDSSPSPRGFSKSQLCLHKILRVIASSAPPPPATTASSNQASSSSSALPDVVSEKDNTCVDRGIGIDLNMEFSLGGGGEGNKPVSAGCAPEGDDKAPHFSGRPGTAAEEEELAGTGSGESAAVVDQRSSEGEFDPNYSNYGGGGGGCNSPTNLLMNESQEIGINGNSDEDDDKREVGDQERREVQNDSRRADEESKVAETATCEGAVGGGGESYYCNDNGNSRTADRRLTVLIEAAELASSTTSDPDETPTTTAEEEEESPSARSRGGGILLTKRKRRSNKCWVVDLYRDDNQMRTAALAPAVSRTKRGRRSQVLPSRYRDSSMVMEPWKPPPRRRS